MVKEQDWLFFENEAYARGYKYVCGVDEAGRGPLAGPVFAAAVILPRGCVIDGVNDSKKLTEKKREQLYSKIKEQSLAYCVASASVDEINEINILNATFLAMTRAVSGLQVKADFALVDGNRLPSLEIDEKAVVKGDALSESIAAASILAKVERDHFMLKLANDYPIYEFEKHKGYGTKLHIEMIKKYGASNVHRKTFLKKILNED